MYETNYACAPRRRNYEQKIKLIVETNSYDKPWSIT